MLTNPTTGDATDISEVARYFLEEKVVEKEFILLDREHQYGNYSEVDLLVPFEKTPIGGMKWLEPDRVLTEYFDYGWIMPSLRQHADFLKLIRSGKAFNQKGERINPEKLDLFFDELTNVKNPNFSTEWLYTKFTNEEVIFPFIGIDDIRRHRQSYGLKKNNYMIRNLPSWLNTADEVGLPQNDAPQGNSGVVLDSRFFIAYRGSSLDCNAHMFFYYNKNDPRIRFSQINKENLAWQ
jgi:hypothetical protein